MSEAVILTCGNARWPGPGSATAVAACPGREELGGPLGELDSRPDRRLVVCGTDADLAAVLLRLLRTDRLGAVPVGYVPAAATSVVARRWDVPVEPEAAATLALRGRPRPVPLVRDDAGGILVGLGLLRPVRGVAYCDNDLVLRGVAARLEVTPDPEHGLAVRVLRRSLFGPRLDLVAAGRAVQLGCAPTSVYRDGVEDRTTDRWTWYRHTQDWHLITNSRRVLHAV